MSKYGLIRPYTAEAKVLRHRFVKYGVGNRTAVTATAASDAIMGVSSELDIDTTGALDIAKTGETSLVIGGTVTKGDFLTSDSAGAGIKAVSGNRYGAMAEESGVTGDQIDVTLCFGKLP